MAQSTPAAASAASARQARCDNATAIAQPIDAATRTTF